MAVLTRSRRTAGPQPPGQGPRRARRRSVPLAAKNVVLVVVCALVFAEGWLQAGHRQPVLALARPVAAGQVITAADLETVRVSAAGPVSLVPASRQAEVVGSTAAVSLPAGSLLAGGDIGTPSPVKGQVRLGVALKPGRYPPGLSPGQHVGVLTSPAGHAPARVAGYAVVLSVTATPAPGAARQTVAVLDLPRDAVPRVAAASAAGRVSLAVIPAGR